MERSWGAPLEIEGALIARFFQRERKGNSPLIPNSNVVQGELVMKK